MMNMFRNEGQKHGINGNPKARLTDTTDTLTNQTHQPF